MEVGQGHKVTHLDLRLTRWIGMPQGQTWTKIQALGLLTSKPNTSPAKLLSPLPGLYLYYSLQ